MSVDAIELLRGRGFVQDVTDEAGLRALLAQGPQTFYVGFDPTAPSLHAGHLVGVMAMAWLQRLGHRPIAIVGGATGRIGDPSGRDTERTLLDDEAIARHIVGIRAQLGAVLDLDADRGLLLDNHDWLGNVSLLGFLRDVGKHFSVNAMIGRESVRRRLDEREQGISYTEFSYQLLQAYDFLHLYREHGCVLQGGGSDQWGNIVAGIDLVRRVAGGEAFGLTWPLLTTSSGAKFGKSAGNAVWLDPSLTSPYLYYQYWLASEDADVPRYLRLFTFLDTDEITELEGELVRDAAARVAHRTLAREATRIVHGQDGLARAEQATEAMHGDAPLDQLDERTLEDMFADVPSTEMAPDELRDGVGVLDAMRRAGAAKSNGEARRLVEQKAVRVNNLLEDDDRRVLTEDDLIGAGMLVISVGRRRRYLVRRR